MGANRIRNLATLFSGIEQDVSLSGFLCLRIVECIGTLAYRSSSETRTRMKTAGLFAIRDSLVLWFLMMDLTAEERVTALTTSVFPFDSVAEQQSFRDANGLLCLLKFFLVEPLVGPEATSSVVSPAVHDLQVMIGDVLLQVFLPVEENKKVLLRLLGNDEVLLQQMEAYEFSSAAFLEWFWDSSQRARRAAIESQLLKLWATVEEVHESKMDRVRSRRNKKLRLRREERAKNKLMMLKILNEQWLHRSAASASLLKGLSEEQQLRFVSAKRLRAEAGRPFIL